MKKKPKILRLGAYKLVELAKIEGIHESTVKARKKAGKYVEILTRTPSGKVSSRLLPMRVSAIILSVFSELDMKPEELFPEVNKDPEMPPHGPEDHEEEF